LSDRDRVLSAVRSAVRHDRAHPGAFVPAAGAREADWSEFAAALAAAGGELNDACAAAELPREVGRLARERAGQGRIVCCPGAAEWLGPDFEVAAPDASPRDFADVSVGIVRGEFAVAETGGVALLRRGARQRALVLLAEHVILLVDAARLEPDLHAAFRALGGALGGALGPAALEGGGVCFVAGPSKTADIELALVVGAHGPRSLGVIPRVG